MANTAAAHMACHAPACTCWCARHNALRERATLHQGPSSSRREGFNPPRRNWDCRKKGEGHPGSAQRRPLSN
eukprot:69407-Chlamydomonas_euryale.AAC.1